MELIKQYDSMQCGIACLQMVCRHYGRNYSSRQVSLLCPPTKEGASMLGLNDAAITLGFNTVSARAEVNELCDQPLPCILHWNQNHFVVLYKVKKGKKFYVADPGKGLVKYNLEEFKSHWISTRSNGEEKGIAMFLEPTPAFYPELFIEIKKENVSLHICKESIIFEVSNNQNNTTFSWAKLIIIIRISKYKQNFFHL